MESLEISKNNVLLFCNKRIHNGTLLYTKPGKILASSLRFSENQKTEADNFYLKRRASSAPGSSARMNASPTRNAFT